MILAQDEGSDDHTPALKLVEQTLSDSQAAHLSNLRDKYKSRLTPQGWPMLLHLGLTLNGIRKYSNFPKGVLKAVLETSASSTKIW